MIEYALVILLTGGSYISPPPARTDIRASASTTSRYGYHIDVAAGLTANTGASHYITYTPNYQADLLELLNEWIENDPVQADYDYETQKAELEKNSISFGEA